MNIRRITTVLLLAFVAVSVAFSLTKLTRRPSAQTALAAEARDTVAVIPEVIATDSTAAVVTRDTISASTRVAPSGTAATARDTLIAYYFHGTFRCATCRTIEAYSREAVTAAFADELARGRIRWMTVNIEMPENAHYVEDYRLTTRSLVLVDRHGGRQRRWKNLDQVWNLVGEKAEFTDYVQDEVRAFLGSAK